MNKYERYKGVDVIEIGKMKTQWELIYIKITSNAFLHSLCSNRTRHATHRNSVPGRVFCFIALPVFIISPFIWCSIRLKTYFNIIMRKTKPSTTTQQQIDQLKSNWQNEALWQA